MGRIRAGRRARSSMFFHLNLDKHVLLEPRHFGKNMREVLEEKLRNEVRARNREERRPSSLLGRPPPPRGFGPRPPARRERDPPRRSIDVTLGVSTPTRPAGAPLAEGNVPEPRSESGLAQAPADVSFAPKPPLSSLAQVEGSCTGRHGFIIMITGLTHVSEGMVTDDGTARAKFHVKYSCIAFRPFKGEVLDATVTQVNKFGFFAEAGPLSLFVSNQLIEDDMTSESVDENACVSADGEVRIQKNAEVRVRVVGMRIDASEIFCIATIKEDYLGVIGKAEEGEGVEEDA